MTARPCYDWSPVGYGSHPVPGDSSEVLRGAREFRATEGYLRSAAQGLAALESGTETESKAIDALDSDMRDLISVLWSALDRYDRAADALTTYAPIMLRAQEDAERALQAAANSRQDYERAASTANDLRRQTMYTFDPDQRRELLEGYNRAKGQASYAQADYLDAKGKIEDAVDMARAAGDRAADAIQSAISNKDLNDSLLDKLKEIGVAVVNIATDALKALGNGIKAWFDDELGWEILDWIALGLTAAGIAALLIGIVFPPALAVGAILLGVSKVLGVVSGIRSAYLGFGALMKGQWLDAGIHFGTAALAGFGLSKIGKFGGKLIKKFAPSGKRGVPAQELQQRPQPSQRPSEIERRARDAAIQKARRDAAESTIDAGAEQGAEQGANRIKQDAR